MAHKIDPHYSGFGGLDTRSNKLMQPKNIYRDGSKNWRHDLEERIRRRFGFQIKATAQSACELGLLEYNYKDLNTGQLKSELLGVNSTGELHRLIEHRLAIEVTSASVVGSYSIFEVSGVNVLKIYHTNGTELGSFSLSDSNDLDWLKGEINGLSITGLSADVVDKNGDPVTGSNCPISCLETTVKEFNKAATDIEYSDAFVWELVNTPSGDAAFPVAAAYKDNPEWTGVSSVNLNNSIYITDGGWPMKYDGYAVYRAGMPFMLKPATSSGLYSNGTVALGGGSTGFTDGVHYFKFQLVYTDPNGVTVYGQPSEPGLVLTTASGNRTVTFGIPAIRDDRLFPVYACIVSGNQTITGGTFVLNVASGHRIKAGMALRVWTSGGPYAARYLKVTAVTSTTITVVNPLSNISVSNNVVINGCYLPEEYVSSLKSIIDDTPGSEQIVYGTTMYVWATRAGASASSTYYRVAQFPVRNTASATVASLYSYTHGLADSSLNYPLIENGESLPRSCAFLSKWQGALIQGGRSLDSNYLGGDYYPTYGVIDPPPSVIQSFERYVYYTEAHLCDFNSVYWSTSENPEGFSQSGEFEEEFITNLSDKITGAIENKEALFVFKERTTAYLTGTLATGDFVKEYLEADIGCVNQNAIQEVRGAVVFLDKFTGFWAVVAGRLPEHIGWPISNIFQGNDFAAKNDFLRLNRAVACNYRLDNQYICYIPAGKREAGESGAIPDATSSSKFFVFDYAEGGARNRSKWDIWQGVDASGGIIARSDDKLYIARKASAVSILYRQKRSGTIYDYSDQFSAIEFSVKSAFLNYGLASIDKDFHKVWINSITGGFNLVIRQYLNYIDSFISSFSHTLSSGKKNPKTYINCNSDKASALSIEFYSNEKNEDISIDGWDLEFSSTYDPGEAVK
jgi:hypothetical protein